MSLNVVILAGGEGKRMQSTLPKVLHTVKNVPMIVRVIIQALTLKSAQIVIVVGSNGSKIQECVADYICDDRILYVVQPVALGTGDAVKCALDILLPGIVVILNGDTPLLKGATISEIIDDYRQNGAQLIVTGIHTDNPAANGRLISQGDELLAIVEHKDCTFEQSQINLVNCGIYVIDVSVANHLIPLIDNNNKQSEYYLTDIVKLYRELYRKSVVLHVLDPSHQLELYNVNSRQELEYVETTSKGNF